MAPEGPTSRAVAAVAEVARQRGATRKALRLAMNARTSTKKNQPSGCST